MKFISLFAGIGGFDLGFERAGMECVAQVETDEFCQKVLAKHWPSVPRYGDIRDVGKHNLPPADLICGGFPCQPFSVAGKRRGAEDDRHLWPEMLRVIAELKPAWVVGENVPGIINIFLDQAISDLEAEGYTCEPVVLPACAFDAPHRRDRLFIVAHTYQDSEPDLPFNERWQMAWTMDVADAIGSDGRGRGVVEEGDGQGRETTETERTCLQPRYGQAYPSESKQGSEDVADAIKQRAQVQTSRRYSSEQKPERNTWWAVEPDVGRVANGVPMRVDRLKSLGNAVVPQVAEFIGRAIMEVEHAYPND